MTIHQRMSRWWQRYVLGDFKTPQDLVFASQREGNDPALADNRFFQDIQPEGWIGITRLEAASWFNSAPFFRQNERADWRAVDPRLQLWVAIFVEMARKRSVPLYVHCALRSSDEQRRLVAAGRSKAIHSAHQIGEAVDIVHGVHHWQLWDKEWLSLHRLGMLALEKANARIASCNVGRSVKIEPLRLNWGGDDGSPSDKFRWDPAHWEIVDYRERLRPMAVSGVPLRMTPRSMLRHRY